METLQITSYKNLKPFSEQGGMGDIFIGYHETSNQQIVVKLVRVSFNHHEALRAYNRFFMEQEIATSVNHPHILQAIAHGETVYCGMNRSYLVYPYIENGSLQKLLENDQPWQNPSWSLSQIAAMISQAAEGLFHLHTRYTMVHLDVKPANFLWKHEHQLPDRRVHIWVSDLGIARLAKDDAHKTLSIVGTRGYMAPEQHDGYLTVSIDQYALAVVARYLLTGFSPQDQDIRTPLTQLNPHRLQSPEIDQVVLKALSRNPKERFPSITDFASALKEAIERQEKPAPQPKIETVFPDIPLQRFEAYVPINNIPPLNPPIQHQPHQANNPLPSFTRLSPVKIPLPLAPTMLSWSPDGSTLVCSSLFHAPVIVQKDTPIQTVSPAQLVCWSPDGQFLLISNGSTAANDLRLWHTNTSTEQPLPLFSPNAPVHTIKDFDWSKQQQLALWIDRYIGIYHVATMQATPRLIKEIALPNMQWSNNPTTLRWSPDGSMLAIGSLEGALFCWNAKTQQPFWFEPPCQQRIYSLAWSTDSSTLAVAYRNKRIEIWNAQQGKKIRVWEHLSAMPLMLSISPHNQLAIATRKELLFGSLGALAPQATLPGQSLVAWSSTQALATLDEHDDTTLLIWKNLSDVFY